MTDANCLIKRTEIDSTLNFSGFSLNEVKDMKFIRLRACQNSSTTAMRMSGHTQAHPTAPHVCSVCSMVVALHEADKTNMTQTSEKIALT